MSEKPCAICGAPSAADKPLVIVTKPSTEAIGPDGVIVHTLGEPDYEAHLACVLDQAGQSAPESGAIDVK